MYARIVNNFLHDMATGTWAACVMVLGVLAHKGEGAPEAALVALRDASLLVFWMAVAALVAIAVTGGIRLGYWRREASPEELAAKRKALIAKHVAFGLIYGPGTVLAWFWATAL